MNKAYCICKKKYHLYQCFRSSCLSSQKAWGTPRNPISVCWIFALLYLKKLNYPSMCKCKVYINCPQSEWTRKTQIHLTDLTPECKVPCIITFPISHRHLLIHEPSTNNTATHHCFTSFLIQKMKFWSQFSFSFSLLLLISFFVFSFFLSSEFFYFFLSFYIFLLISVSCLLFTLINQLLLL